LEQEWRLEGKLVSKLQKKSKVRLESHGDAPTGETQRERDIERNRDRTGPWGVEGQASAAKERETKAKTIRRYSLYLTRGKID